jgi:hypothetical protein
MDPMGPKEDGGKRRQPVSIPLDSIMTNDFVGIFPDVGW